MLLTVLAIGCASSLVARGIGHLSELAGAAPAFHERLRTIPEALPRLAARQEQAVLVFGSSVIEGSLDPLVVDDELGKRGIPVSTYNLGVAALPYTRLSWFVNMGIDAYKAVGKRPAAIVIVVCPTQLAWPGDDTLDLEYLLLAGSIEDYVAKLSSDLEAGLQLFAKRYAKGGFSGAYVSRRFTRWIDEDVPRWFGDQTEQQRVQALYVPTPPWTLERRGSARSPDPEAAQYQRWFEGTRQLRADEMAQAVQLEDSTPIIEENVLATIATITASKSASDKVIVVAPPRNPCHVQRTSSAEQKFTRILERITREGGAPLLDLRFDAVPECDDFVDLIHMNRVSGAQKFNKAFAASLAPLLR